MPDPREYDERGDVTKHYLTPDEARATGVPWAGRPGEPDDLRDPYHYQSPDEARQIGVNWATQPNLLAGRGPAEHAGIQGVARATAPGSAAWQALQGYGYGDYTGPLSGLMAARPSPPDPHMAAPTQLLSLEDLMAFMQAQRAR